MYFCLPNISNFLYIQHLRDMVPTPSQNTMAVCNQFTFLIHYYISSRLLTLLNVTDAPIQTSDIVVLIAYVRFTNFNFKIILVFVPLIYSSFMPYIV